MSTNHKIKRHFSEGSWIWRRVEEAEEGEQILLEKTCLILIGTYSMLKFTVSLGSLSCLNSVILRWFSCKIMTK